MMTVIMILSSFVYGQVKQPTDADFNKSGAAKLLFTTSVDEVKKLALNDIKNNHSFLLLQSGISPVIYQDDQFFEENFKVYYTDYGCSGPSQEVMKQYNYTIFNHLDKKYGHRWRKEVRKDVIGFKKWRKNN